MTTRALRFAVCWLWPALLPAAISIDARKPPDPPKPLPFAAGGRSPAGHTLAINSRYLTLDGKPWFPVMGEFHYSRYPAADWERELLKMKAGGVQIVSTYVFWIHHEEIEGQFDWSGRRDLRHFVELAARHGLYVWVRIGPWDHGEVRNGGLPDWVLRKSTPRQNDPAYLQYVGRFYGEIGRQLHGLFWKDGGPIAGVQIENEYHERGPGKGAEHLLTLLRIARDAGIDAPFYSITGWDDAVIPDRGLIPVFGGYPDGFWYRSLSPLPPSADYFFTAIRCDENVGGNLRSLHPDIDARFVPYPYLTAEMAGGMELAYHRRPLMSADDIAALDIAKLGSGVTLYGYYMFHGGTNPDGKLTTLQESQATGYPNDLPVKNYDFQAPLGEFGQVRPSFRDLKTIHLFLHDFGPDLAPMPSYLPDRLPSGKLDTATPRVAARAGSGRAFLFLNNYQKDHPLPDHPDFQVELKLRERTVTVPRQPISVPAGAYTFWPVEMPVGGAVLEYATAQLLCALDHPNTLVFFAWPGIASEFVFRAAGGVHIDAPRAEVKREDGRLIVSGISPSAAVAIQVGTTQILLLSREQARNLWKAPIAGRERLILSPADLYFDGDQAHLSSSDPALLRLGVFPPLETTPAGFSPAAADGIFAQYATAVPPVRVQPEVREIAAAGQAPPVRMGPEVAMAPTDADFQAAARWSIRVPEVKAPGVGEVYLRIHYQGDVARLYAGRELIADDFYHGVPWEIGLRNLSEAAAAGRLELLVLPGRADAPVYPKLVPGARLIEVEALPQYHAVAVLAPKHVN
ncbi:MAG TPA: beta-galactosidase [Bryobacteraceae bacterium]|nr:beta-galactosidase [Bryobacteraceae bacterium]